MINILLSSDKLNNAQICPKLYNYIHEIQKVPPTKEEYFQEGELFHYVLAEYYTHIMKSEEVNRELLLILAQNYAAEKLELSSEALSDAIADINMYFDWYISGKETWLIEAEEPFAKVLYEDSDVRIVIQGKCDLKVRTNNGKGPLAIVDHKYEASFRRAKERDNQPLCYSWAFESRDFVYNRIGKQKSYKPEDRLKRDYVCYAQHQIDEWKESAIYTALEILKFSESNYWPSRFSGCNIYGKRCTYHDICNTSPSNRDYKLSMLFANKSKHNLMEDK